MKKFFPIFIAVIALCVSSFAQKKAVADPCLSKDPKVRAASKKPCPSAPTPKKTKPADSPSDERTTKKTNPVPPKNKTPKKSDGDGTMFFIEIIHNGEKTELAYTQFEEHGGQATLGGSRMNFFYGAGNSTMNDDDFMFTGMIPTAAKGTYLFGTDGVMLSFKADKFPNVPMFLCDTGQYEITAMPLPGGFVEGNFTAQCVGEISNDGSTEKYAMTGRFKLLRMT